MPRFSLTQLFMGIALVGILLTLVQSEGCGKRYSQIECISYNPVGTRLLVSRLDARDARTPGKGYKSNVARKLSVFDAVDGSNERIVHQDYRAGNQGPAFNLWRHNRTSTACLTSNSVVAHEFGGGPLIVFSIDG
jgi:hypothetical protein